MNALTCARTLRHFLPAATAVLLAAGAAGAQTLQEPAPMRHGPVRPDHEMAMAPHKPALPSHDLALTGIGAAAHVVTPAELRAMPHVSITVTNGHTHASETYSGVPVLELLKLIPTDASTKPRPLTTVLVAQGTDGYRVVISLCDVDSGCRKGQAIVADTLDGKPLTEDGEFKLVLSEDAMPRRWVRNLTSLTEKTID